VSGELDDDDRSLQTCVTLGCLPADLPIITFSVTAELLGCARRSHAPFIETCCFFVSAWYAETYYLLLFVSLSVSVTLLTISSKFGSRNLVDRLSQEHEIWQVDRRSLATVHQCQDQ